MARDEVRRHYRGDNYALTTELGGAGDHIVPLAEDAFAETDPITDYPDGISIMPISDTADWAGYSAPGSVTTHNVSGSNWQLMHVRFVDDPDTNSLAFRTWDESGSVWGVWSSLITGVQFAAQYDALHGEIQVVADDLANLDVFYLENLGEGSFAESDTPANYYNGLSIHQVAAVEDWGGFGKRAFVVTEGDLTNATQTMHAFDGSVYQRAYTSGTWSAWTAFSMEGHTHSGYVATTDYEDTDVLNKVKNVDGVGSGLDADKLDGVEGAGYTPIAHVGSGGAEHANAVASGASGFLTGSDKAKLDGVESGAAADQTAAEILTAIKTVDGTGSGLDADLLDGQSSAAFAAAGAAPTAHAASHTNGTDDIQNATATQKGLATAAQITKLDGVETGATADQTASEILTAIKTVDGSASGLDADLLDGIEASAFAASTHSHVIADLPVADDGESNVNEVVRSNDSRLSNTRTPTDSSVTNAKVAAAAAIDESKLNLASDAAAGTASRRTLGTGATQAAPGNDSRLSDARTPTSHASSHVGADSIQDATSSQKGLATPTQITKLDGIATGATADRVTPLTTDSLLFTAALSSFPDGLSEMKSVAEGTANTFAQNWGEDVIVVTLRSGTQGVQYAYGLEVEYLPGHRYWRPGTSDWGGWVFPAGGFHAAGHAWDGADSVRPTVRALQTIGAAGAIAVGSNWVILVTATADRTGITVNAGAFDGQFIQIINRSAFSLTFNATEATSRVVGGGAIAPASSSLLVWDANYGGVGTGRWVRLPADAHGASAVSFSPTGTIAATDVQSAIAEVASEASSGGLSLTEIEVDLGSPAMRSGSFQITGLSGLSAGRPVLITQSNGPYTGKGNLADEAEMDQVSVTGKTTSTTAIQCYWTSSAPVLGNFKFAYVVG